MDYRSNSPDVQIWRTRWRCCGIKVIKSTAATRRSTPPTGASPGLTSTCTPPGGPAPRSWGSCSTSTPMCSTCTSRCGTFGQALYPGDASSLQGAVRDMMNALYRCDFSVLKLYAGTQNMTTSFIFGWKMNKVICSEPLCESHKRHEVGLVKEDQCAKCPKRDIRDLEEGV